MLDFIQAYHRDRGYAPTIREIGCAVGIKTLNGTRTHLNRLREAGIIDFVPCSPRTVRVLRQPHYDEAL